jgi:glycosyltransferase involved in cell wall biosynthesis
LNYKKKFLISIVIPTYNHGTYLKRALQSVLDQTYLNWEAIVIDNHSTDDTGEIMTNFTDQRIKYLKIHNNDVIAVSRNAGINIAKGEWIAFLDSDDWWTEDKLEICFKNINDEIDLVYHDLEIKYTHPRFLDRKKIKSRHLKKPVLVDLLVDGNAISNSSVIVRKKFFDEINGIDENKNLVAAEDYNTWLRIANLTDQFLYIPEKLGFYLIHNQSTSNKDMSVPARQAVAEFTKILNSEQKIKLEAFLRYVSGRYNYLNSNYNNSRKDLLFTLINGSIPLRIRALVMIIVMMFIKKKKNND